MRRPTNVNAKRKKAATWATLKAERGGIRIARSRFPRTRHFQCSGGRLTTLGRFDEMPCLTGFASFLGSHRFVKTRFVKNLSKPARPSGGLVRHFCQTHPLSLSRGFLGVIPFVR